MCVVRDMVRKNKRYMRECSKCGNIFITNAKYGKVCLNCDSSLFAKKLKRVLDPSREFAEYDDLLSVFS
jgi:rRNA maturation endonuclease Nob1